MGDHLVPPEYWSAELEPKWRNYFENTAAVRDPEPCPETYPEPRPFALAPRPPFRKCMCSLPVAAATLRRRGATFSAPHSSRE